MVLINYGKSISTLETSNLLLRIIASQLLYNAIAAR